MRYFLPFVSTQQEARLPEKKQYNNEALFIISCTDNKVAKGTFYKQNTNISYSVEITLAFVVISKNWAIFRKMKMSMI